MPIRIGGIFILEISVNQKHDISLHGGTDKVSYYFSAGYMDDSSVLNYGTDIFQKNESL